MGNVPELSDWVPTGNELAGMKWWTALRRAYRVPEIIQDEEALWHIGDIVSDSLKETADGNERLLFGASAAWLLVQLGDEGKLDGVVLKNPNAGVDTICRNGASKIPGPGILQDKAGTLAKDAASFVCSYVRDHPSGEWPVD